MFLNERNAGIKYKLPINVIGSSIKLNPNGSPTTIILNVPGMKKNTLKINSKVPLI